MDNGWNEWSRYVLNEIQRLHETVEKLQASTTEDTEILLEKIASLKSDVRLLFYKTSAVGGSAGFLAAVVISVIDHYVSK